MTEIWDTIKDRAASRDIALRRHATELVKPQPRIWGLGQTRSGVRVNEDLALTYSAVWAAVRVISETVAGLPWHQMRRTSSGVEREDGSVIDTLLSRRPNDAFMTPFTFREKMLHDVLLWGNAYAEIGRNTARAGPGKPEALWPLNAENVQPMIVDDVLVYVVRNPGTGVEVVLPARDMLHVHGLGFDGLVGYSVIAYAAQSIGLGLATERFGSSFFGNGSRPSGVLTHPDQMSDTAYKNFRERFEDIYRGTDNAQKVAILEEGMKFETIGVPPEDAQFLETRSFQVLDVARWFRIQPHKLAHLVDAHFTNISEQNTEFRTDTITPWVTRFEQEADLKLVGNDPKRFTKMNIGAVLRADIKTRYEAYQVAINNGFQTVNETRRLEDLNSIGSDGDEHYLQMNMTTLADIAEPLPPISPPTSNVEQGDPGVPPAEDDRVRVRRANLRVFVDALDRILNRERHRITDSRKKYATKRTFKDWAERFYVQHEEYVLGAISQPMLAVVEFFGPVDSSATARLDIVAGQFVQDHISQSKGDLDNDVIDWTGRADEEAERLLGNTVEAAMMGSGNGHA